MRELVLLGSTGSIGTQAIDIVRRNGDKFRVVGLGAGGGNVELLAAQALELQVDVVGVARASVVQDLQLAFYAEAQRRGYATGGFRIPKIVAGPDAMTELAAWPCDVVLNGVVGSIGLAPTLAALRNGRILALANKESLVAGGGLVKAALRKGGQEAAQVGGQEAAGTGAQGGGQERHGAQIGGQEAAREGAQGGRQERQGAQIVPVDSEHSALAQCLRGGTRAEVRRLVLTASGGAFRDRRREELADVTPEEALKHPTWDMGPVVTINSATMVNKGLEVIEAHELFDVPYADIEVMIHPQSVLHSLVEFADGSTLAQASPPDMRLPIALALAWPDRVPAAAAAVDWREAHNWELRPLDPAVFPAVDLAKQAGAAGHPMPAVYNAANEECVAAFVAGRLPFLGIVDTLERVLATAPGFAEPGTVEEVLAAEAWARAQAQRMIATAAEGA